MDYLIVTDLMVRIYTFLEKNQDEGFYERDFDKFGIGAFSELQIMLEVEAINKTKSNLGGTIYSFKRPNDNKSLRTHNRIKNARKYLI